LPVRSVKLNPENYTSGQRKWYFISSLTDKTDQSIPMNRRNFHKTLGLLTAGLALRPIYSSAFDRKATNRITMSTVNFRERFAQTKTGDARYNAAPLTLLKIPAYFSERFGLNQVELWSKHFESLSPAYLKDLKSALTKSKSKLVNIQFDEDYQIGSPDESKRKKSVELALQWLDAAHFLGSGAFRVNPGNGEVGHAINSLKTINQACKAKGLVLMVENHFGMEMNPDIHLQIVREVGDNTYTLPDFGNYSNEVRYEALRKIMPYAYQVSAKTMAFDENLKHTSFDFDQCMKICVDSGFKGIYSVEQWSREPINANDEAIADWMIARIKTYL
jgi:sugar phosphate isomerase/epimerase